MDSALNKMLRMTQLDTELQDILSRVDGARFASQEDAQRASQIRDEQAQLQSNARNINEAAEMRQGRSGWNPKDLMREARSYERQQSELMRKRPVSQNYIDQMQDNIVRQKGSAGLESAIEEAGLRSQANIGALKDAGYTDMINKRNFRSLAEQGKSGLELRTMKDPISGKTAGAALPELLTLMAAEKAFEIPAAGEGSDIVPKDAKYFNELKNKLTQK